MRIAVVGYGNMGQKHVRALRSLPGVEVSAIVEPDITRHPQDSPLLTLFHPTLDSAFEEAVRWGEPLSGVVVASPTPTHGSLAVRALREGVPVLVEKPLTSTMDEADEVLATAEHMGQPLMAGLVERFNPVVRRLWAELRAKMPLLLAARRSGLPNPVPTQTVSADLATHDIDIINWLLGELPSSVAGWDRDGVMDATLAYSSGALGSVSADWRSPYKVRDLRVVCEDGTYELDYIEQSLVWHPVGGEAVQIEVLSAEPLVLEDAYFVETVVATGFDPLETAFGARVAMDIVAAVEGGAA